MSQPRKFKPTSLIPSLVALYGLHNLVTSKEESASKNECGGILAYISKGDDDARQFCRANAHLLQKTPYQQCGISFRSEAERQLNSCKFTTMSSEQLTMAFGRVTNDEYMLQNHMIVD